MIEVVNGIIISDKKVLLCEKNGILIFPGGKKEPGENDERCLRREVKEETGSNITKIEKLFCEESGISPSSIRKIEVKAYLITIDREPRTQKGDSIKKIKWVEKTEFAELVISTTTKKILKKLIKEKML